MKKLLYVFLCVTAMVFASCGNKVATTNEDCDTTEVVDTVDTIQTDTVA